VLAYLLGEVRGPGLIVVIVSTQALSALFLAMALSPGTSPRPEQGTAWRSLLAFAIGSFALVLFTVLYQIVYRVSLPVPNTMLAPAAALLLSLGSLGSRRGVRPIPSVRRTLLAGGIATLLLVPAGMALARSAPESVGNGASLRLMSYNVHLGIDGQGQLDPEAIAMVIEAQHPDVVCLQEVVRGWPGAGGMDLAEWLSHRLRMPYAYAPAADDQFGNVVLSRLPLVSHLAVPLPKISGHMRRSYLVATVEIGGGRSITVIDAHLEGSQPDRRSQAEQLVARWGHAQRTVIAGDMNMQPTDPDVSIFEAAGLVSAQDEEGQGSRSSATRPNFPGDRPDWIFGSPELSFSGFLIGPVSPSDHRPLVVTVTIG